MINNAVDLNFTEKRFLRSKLQYVGWGSGDGQTEQTTKQYRDERLPNNDKASFIIINSSPSG